MENFDVNNVNQKNLWSGEFGNKYVERINTKKFQNETYKNRTGFTEEEIFKEFFNDLDRNISILEVGCNRGLKLSILENMGFQNISGVEVNQNAAKIAKEKLPSAKIYNESIEEFDSQSNQYDLVFTATMLIHVNPLAIEDILLKIINLSKKYIFGFEYYSEQLIEVPYRDQKNALWKQNLPELFKKIDCSLVIEKQRIIPYKNDQLKDITYLLRKNQ
ncbi:MAG: pseudaminic acid biosynthesis-associated methylase [Candidatus Nitrosopumilus sp. bin_32a]